MKIALRAVANNLYVSADDLIPAAVNGEDAIVSFPNERRPLVARAEEVRSWEQFEILTQNAAGEWVPLVLPVLPVQPPDPVTPPHDPPAVVSGPPGWDVPRGVNFSDQNQVRAFVTSGRLIAFHTVPEGDFDWLGNVEDLLIRGAQLGMVPPERYFWERLLGRASGGEWVAKFGPYAGLEEHQGSLTYGPEDEP